jgi:hypothetical protein
MEWVPICEKLRAFGGDACAPTDRAGRKSVSGITVASRDVVSKTGVVELKLPSNNCMSAFFVSSFFAREAEASAALRPMS